MMDINMAWLEEHLFHRTLSSDDKRILKGLVERKSYNKGDMILEENQEPEGLFILENGKVALEHQKNGQHVRIAKLEEGSQFGDMSLFDDEKTSVSVKALEACTLYLFSQKSMTYMMEYRQSLSNDIMLNTIRSLAQAIRQMNDAQAYTSQYLQGRK
ncbi:MAG: cyclic nucleotide-binding domain-containing protein [Mariprofundaceae bacterium]|nr:cyclic nucleotide-binding domain-containing protein [Mariprofundaceae bacterium]